MNTNHLQLLRDRKPLSLFDRTEKLFTQFQFNFKENDFVCWKRYVSKDRRNWICWNEFLSLKDINSIINQMLTKQGKPAL